MAHEWLDSSHNDCCSCGWRCAFNGSGMHVTGRCKSAQRRHVENVSKECQDCHGVLLKGMPRNTGRGFYEDGEVLCGFCISDRNHAAELEIRPFAEPAVPLEETVERNSRG